MNSRRAEVPPKGWTGGGDRKLLNIFHGQFTNMDVNGDGRITAEDRR